ncbi:MAG: hypothetical protein ACI4P5_10585, partial [Candidatus Fimadaptatus sp.]
QVPRVLYTYMFHPPLDDFFSPIILRAGAACQGAQSKARRAKNGENVKQIYFTKLRRWYIMEGRVLRGQGAAPGCGPQG